MCAYRRRMTTLHRDHHALALLGCDVWGLVCDYLLFEETCALLLLCMPEPTWDCLRDSTLLRWLNNAAHNISNQSHQVQPWQLISAMAPETCSCVIAQVPTVHLFSTRPCLESWCMDTDKVLDVYSLTSHPYEQSCVEQSCEWLCESQTTDSHEMSLYSSENVEPTYSCAYGVHTEAGKYNVRVIRIEEVDRLTSCCIKDYCEREQQPCLPVSRFDGEMFSLSPTWKTLAEYACLHATIPVLFIGCCYRATSGKKKQKQKKTKNPKP